MFEYIGHNGAAAHNFAAEEIGKIDGWFGGNQIHIFDTINKLHYAEGVRGNILEIGVHHGRSFCFLQHLSREDEAVFAVDIFDDQHLNQEFSGRGGKEIFLENVEKYGRGRQNVVVIASESTRVTPLTLEAHGKGPYFRLVHVDGSHVANVVAKDMALASSILGPGGVVVVDDYQLAGWPGVSEGVARYMLLDPGCSLSPICVAEGKGVFVRKTEQRRMLELFRSHFPISPYWVRSHYDSDVVVF